MSFLKLGSEHFPREIQMSDVCLCDNLPPKGGGGVTAEPLQVSDVV